MKHSFPLHRKLFLSHFLATLLVSSALGLFVYVTARDSLLEQLRHRLSSSAALVSRELDADRLRAIRSEGDVDKEGYEVALQQLREMRRSNADIAFLYVMRKDGDGTVRFVVDSDESEAQALPGREYRAVNAALLDGFRGQSADRDYTTDVWGTFMSGYAPLVNGAGEYLVGIDMRADQVKGKLATIKTAAGVGFVGSLMLSWLVAGVLSRHFKKPIDAIVAQCEAVAEGDFEGRVELERNDEMERLLAAVNEMTSDLRRAREDNLRLAESLDEAIDKDRGS